ncbi:hypothetical protein L227DRAFT_561459 [Lentinus tigrinus ALCF2SS1-6]|uniref:Zn(2)-C6 fungal-type domain-containing protein n=1 Tax=Lentinus tigrinus ALCF2SS1-6 TaxID=1328759 RepID=A0A5C2SHI4_9APHY|nr:hypothetical protein L227DRAFT_561459 [Lentinus tigrinus ALCF2SS1-6]
MAPATTVTDGAAEPGPGKVKALFGCSECTRRRQKCDRQIPCSLCVSRGIPQLCRWEPLVSRPAPQKPPEGAPVASHQSTIAALSARIAVLEQTILRQNALAQSPTEDAAGTSANPDLTEQLLREFTSSGDSPTTDDQGSSTTAQPSDSAELSRYDFEVQLAAIKMAQMSLAPQNEYIGGGTVLCAIHKLGDPENYRFPYARATTAFTLNNAYLPGSNPLTEPIQKLLAALPPRETVAVLVDAFFAERGWQFGLPEGWFKNALSRMWAHLDIRCPGQSCHMSGGCARCTKEVNPHWLTLVFAVLALAPRRLVGTSARVYFWNAMEARRLIEDIMICTPAYSLAPTECMVHGIALSCLAASLLASYLSNRGRVSDAWKIVGCAVRNAQAVGMHRDPGWHKWEKMDREECELRLLAWWLLIIYDRLYSLILGRPTIAGEETFDVKLIPGAVHGDGSPNPYMHYQHAFIGLAHLIDETVTKCIGILTPAYATVLEVDRKFKQWLSKLDPSMDWRQPHTLPASPTHVDYAIALQRHTCAAYYLGTLMNLHRPYLMHAPPILPLPRSPSSVTSAILNPSRERCIELGMELVRVLCDAQEEVAQWDTEQMPFVVFHYAYFVFDGAVAMVGALSQQPPHPKAKECLALIDRATRMLEKCKEANSGATDGEADVSSRATTILAALRKAGRWDERFGVKTNGALASSPEKAPTPSPSSSNASTSRSGSVESQPAEWDSFSAMVTMPIAPGPPSFAELSGLNAAFAPPMHSAFPFLNAPRQNSSFPPMPGPLHVESSHSQTSCYGDAGVGQVPMAAPVMELDGATHKTNLQTMIMPFDMLLNSNSYDVDWDAVMGSTGWSGEGSAYGGGPSVS